MLKTPPKPSWETLSIAATREKLDLKTTGLNSKDVTERLARYGSNLLPEKKPPNFPALFLHQFQSPLIYILLIAAGVSLGLGDWLDAVFIFFVLLVNALVGSIQEWRAEKGAQALQKLLKGRATALRNGQLIQIDSEGIVPGDLVWLESGDHVPADIRILSSRGLSIDESLLTGESVPTSKTAEWTSPGPIGPGDRKNMLHAGTIVVRGRGEGLVVATGLATELGRIAEHSTASDTTQPPLLIRMQRFTRNLGIAIMAASIVTVIVGVLKGYGVREMFFAGVALAVSAIPEGLPVAITVALAVTSFRMVKRNVIVRRLAAVEGLGSCTLIVSDKTGTLTVNELTVRKIFQRDGLELDVTGQGFIPEGAFLNSGIPFPLHQSSVAQEILESASLNNEADLFQSEGKWSWRGDPADIALLALAFKGNVRREILLDKYPLVNAIPFEPERRFSASFHQSDNGSIKVHVKGAPERVLPMCDLNSDAGRKWMNEALRMAQSGIRILAVASGSTTGIDKTSTPSEPSNLRFLGFLGMIDPLRPGTSDAVKKAKMAGVRTLMVTGDHPETAFAISRELGIAQQRSEVISGSELESLTLDEIGSLVNSSHVFARMAPDQKLLLVQAAQTKGHFVAVTGDGANDAPALRKANIGIAMGKAGTDVARQAADLVIRDDQYSSIINGIEEGRIAYDNIRKVILLLLSTGAVEIVIVVGALVANLPLPLTAVQLLWLNLVTNGVQDVALATEPGEPHIMKLRPRKPGERVIDRNMIEQIALTALTIGGIGIALFWYLIQQGWRTESARNVLLLFMVLFENIQIGNVRSETRSIFRVPVFGNRFLLLAVLITQALHIGSMYSPIMQKILEVEPLPFTAWIFLIPAAMTSVLAIELHKIWVRKKRFIPAPE